MWVRFTVRIGETILVSYGSTKTERHPGEAVAEIYYPTAKGVKDADALVDTIREAFRSVDTAGSPVVRFSTPYKRNMPREDGFDRVNVHMPYFSDETYT